MRPYNWSMGVQLQQEIVPRVSVNVGYFRNWWGNWYVVDNRPTSAADYTPFSITAPVDPRLPNGGGYAIDGLYNPVSGVVGLVDELAQASSKFGDQTENWQGVDVGVAARLRNGLTIQGGTSTGPQAGRRLRRAGEVAGARTRLERHHDQQLRDGERHRPRGRGTALGVMNPYCRIEEPYRTDFRGLATYTIPKVDVQVSGTWTSAPGTPWRRTSW